MNYLSPSILAADFANLGRDVSIAASNGAEYIHIDVMDGVFVPNISLGFPIIESLRKCCDKIFDVHLMIRDPEKYVERFARSGADIITFHIESTDQVKETIDIIHACGKKAGISLKPGTPVSAIEGFLPYIDMVLVMTVEPGFGGQKFMFDMLQKAKKLNNIKENCGYKYDIEADGGITLGNVDSVIEAGVNVVVAGSSVFQKDRIAENTFEFIKKISSSGGN